MDCEGIRVKPILALLPEGSNEIGVLSRLSIGLRTCRLEMRSYWPLLPSSPREPVRELRRSFLLTAAGQFRTHTGFP